MRSGDRDTIIHEEILELLYMRQEDGGTMEEDRLLEQKHGGHRFTPDNLEAMVGQGLIEKRSGTVRLTPAGMEKATNLIRCHRLAERLLVDVLNVRDEIVESSACRFEHFLSTEVVDSICTLLGHPSFCPHNRPIPPGSCCRHAEKEVLPILKPLSQLSPGEEGVVGYISSPYHQRLSRLASLGLAPGTRLRVRQVKPSFIIQMGEMELALEERVAREIYLRVRGNQRQRS